MKGNHFVRKANKIKDQVKTEQNSAKSLETDTKNGGNLKTKTKKQNKDCTYQAKKAAYTLEHSSEFRAKTIELLSRKLKRLH